MCRDARLTAHNQLSESLTTHTVGSYSSASVCSTLSYDETSPRLCGRRLGDPGTPHLSSESRQAVGGAAIRVAQSAGRPGLAGGTPLAPGRTWPARIGMRIQRAQGHCSAGCQQASAGWIWLMIHVDVFNRCRVHPAMSERPCARHRSPLACPQAAAAWRWERVAGLPANATILESGISMRPASGEGVLTSLAAWTGAQYYSATNGRLVNSSPGLTPHQCLATAGNPLQQQRGASRRGNSCFNGSHCCPARFAARGPS